MSLFYKKQNAFDAAAGVIGEQEVEIEVITCEECGCLLEKENAQIMFPSSMIRELAYCRIHRRPYDEVRVKLPMTNFPLSYEYYKKIEVDKEGNPIGYIKKKD